MVRVGGQCRGSRLGVKIGGGSRSGVKGRGSMLGSSSGEVLGGLGQGGGRVYWEGRLKIKRECSSQDLVIEFRSIPFHSIPFQSIPFYSMFYPMPANPPQIGVFKSLS